MSASERDRASLVRRHVEEGLSQREASERIEPLVAQNVALVAKNAPLAVRVAELEAKLVAAWIDPPPKAEAGQA